MSKNKGKIFFFSGPSGAGKGTLIDILRKKHPDWVFPPSCTTRSPRPKEIEGKTYFFISKAEFREKIKNNEFLEYAEIHNGNFYGTLREKLLSPLKDGKIVIREFDVQGFSSARKKLNREDYVSIFITAKGGEKELIRRITERSPISAEEIAKRMDSMKKEISQKNIYDYEIVSYDGEVEKLVNEAEEIITKNT